MSHLYLVRHGQSEWNALGQWTGLTDVNLNDQGRLEAQQAGQVLKDIHFDHIYVSALKRAQQTLDEIQNIHSQKNIPTTVTPAINERDYGDLTGKNKWKIKEEYGETQFTKWRRGWDDIVPNGESLKDVYNRVIPYYKGIILPQLQAKQNILVVAHGNSLRALIKFLNQISDQEITHLEVGLGEIYHFELDTQGNILSQEILSANPLKGKI